MIFPSMAQDETEFDELLIEVSKISVESILEIGTWAGGTLARFGNTFPWATLVSIDPAPQIERWAPEWGSVHFIYGKSQDTSVRGQAITANQHRKFDFIWIDGDHEYHPTYEDWIWATRNATKMIAIHDIVDSNNPMIQTHMIWDEIHASEDWETKEIKNAGGNYGIGVVYL